MMGAGVALFDYDNDGDLDVFLVQGGAARRRCRARRPTAPSRLFRNDLTVGARRPAHAALHRRDRARRHRGCGYGMGAAVGDYDNDGDLDLFVTAFGPDDALPQQRQRHVHRRDHARPASATRCGAPARRSSTTTATATSICSSPTTSTSRSAANKVCTDPVGARDYCSPRAYRPVPDGCSATRATAVHRRHRSAPASARPYGAGLGVAVGDYNGDGWLDLYVANDATPNQLWINRRDGTFVDEGLLSGSALNAAGNPEGSMGIASGDFDADGDEDLFVTNIVGETFVLYVNDGTGNFDDARARPGLAAPTAAFTGFGTDWLDYDNDGWLDLFVANGAVNIDRGAARAAGAVPDEEPAVSQHRRKAGSTRRAPAAGRRSRAPEVGRGAAFGDIDNDGDVDIVVTNNNGPVRLLLNQAGDDAITGCRSASSSGPATGSAIGAWVGVERAGQPTLWRRVRTDGSYLSASDVRVHFGLGSSSAVDRRGRAVAGRPAGALDRRHGRPAADVAPRHRSFMIAACVGGMMCPCKTP